MNQIFPAQPFDHSNLDLNSGRYLEPPGYRTRFENEQLCLAGKGHSQAMQVGPTAATHGPST
jgi:hypothetical protein